MAFKAGEEKDSFGLDDLRIGTFIHVFGRSFFIHDCDDFTRQWYKVRYKTFSTALVFPLMSKPEFDTWHYR